MIPILLINAHMSAIVGTSTSVSRINVMLGLVQYETVIEADYFNIYVQDEFNAQLTELSIKIYSLGARSDLRVRYPEDIVSRNKAHTLSMVSAYDVSSFGQYMSGIIKDIGESFQGDG